MKWSILVISSECLTCNKIFNTFEDTTSAVFCAKSSVQALEKIVKNTYSLIILDSLVNDMDRKVLLYIIRRLSRIPILVLTRQKEIEERIELLNLGADDCLVWPANIDDLIVRVEVCLKKVSMRRFLNLQL